MTKRANGEGSVGRRGDGRGRQACYCVVEDDGVLRRHTIYAPTRDEATAKLRAAIRAREEGGRCPPGSTRSPTTCSRGSRAPPRRSSR